MLQISGQNRTSKNTGFKGIETKTCKQKIELSQQISDEYRRLPATSNLLDCERYKILIRLALECQALNEQALAEAESIRTVDETSPSTIQLKKHGRAAPAEVIDQLVENGMRGGVSLVVSLREDLLHVLRIMESKHNSHQDYTVLQELDRYLKLPLLLWFSPDTLEIRRITYDNSAKSIIELIAKKEAVHPMESLDELRTRLGPGRRVFALFSPLLPDQPLVFCHAALTDDIPNTLDLVLNISEEAEPRVAAFYSISSSQPGLAGLKLGEHLLKNAMERLRNEFPSIKSFVTLSPIPGFRKWVETKISFNRMKENSTFHDGSFVSKADENQLKKIGVTLEDNECGMASLSSILKTADPSQLVTHTEQSSVVNSFLTKLSCRYILLEKHRRRPFCGVARFHVGNGAEVHRINFGADLSPKGIQQSYSLMVNYKYDLDNVAENQARFESDFHMSASKEVLNCIIEDHEE